MTSADHPDSLVSARPHITRVEDGSLHLHWPESYPPTTEITRDLMIEIVACFNELNEINRGWRG